VLRQRYYGSALARTPGRAGRALHLKEARRLIQQYRNRKATTHAVELAGRVPNYRPNHEFSLYLRAAHELERLGTRASPDEILERAVGAYVAIESDEWNFPDGRAEHHYIGRCVLAALQQRDANGHAYRLKGRVVSEIGRHVSDLLGPYCRTLVRTAKRDAESVRAAVEQSVNFAEAAR
jgi:hypothetical protein